jgi:hypothetical protein
MIMNSSGQIRTKLFTIMTTRASTWRPGSARRLAGIYTTT